MANIDYGTLALGALIGIGCRKQLKAAGRVVATTAASLASAAASAVQQVAKETQSPEEAAAEEFLSRVDQQIAGTQAGGKKNG